MGQVSYSKTWKCSFFCFQVKITRLVNGVGTSGAMQHVYYTEVVDSQHVSEGMSLKLCHLCSVCVRSTSKFSPNWLHLNIIH